MSGEKQPAKLAYFVIYNPTLGPGHYTEDDDELEQSHILFYFSHSQAVSRDTMLRQVGLAKALVNFSILFTKEHLVDSVHSHQRRMVMISPEPHYWIHACIDLARASRPPPKAKEKGTEAGTELPEAFDYSEHHIHDIVLREYLQRSYDEFRLLHGTLEETLQQHGKGTLEKILEQFYNIWISTWDVSAPRSLPLHMGIPLHPRHGRVAAQIQKLVDILPPTSNPFILDNPSSSLLAVPPQGSYPASLPRYLRYHMSSSDDHTTRKRVLESALSSVLDSTQDQTATAPDHQSAAALAPGPLSVSRSLAAPLANAFVSTSNAAVTAGTTLISPFQSMPRLTNPKKWWPGYLTIKRPISEPKEAQDTSATDTNKGSTEALGVVRSGIGAERPSDRLTHPSTDAEAPPHTIDQISLEEAMSPLGGSGIWEHSALPPSPPPPPSFSELRVHLPVEIDGHTTEQRKLLHLTNYGITLAVLLDPRSETDLQAIRGESTGYYDSFEDTIAETMRDIRAELDQLTTDVPLCKPSLTSSTTAPSQFVIYDSDSKATLVYKDSYFGDGNQVLFGTQDTFERQYDPLEIIESTTRSTSNHWYASRMGRPNPRGMSGIIEMKPGSIVHLDVGNTQSSLVDVDAELGILVRKMAEKQLLDP
ncbi:uncharacterized protein EI90DRAFT_3076910 [Cantharellus anzutake]|uniref:uncharacterized protein n=1 Tax=Cantharellus anzutake TaxID=1750568 RepID=UPI00190593CC|nr:uncharacterized protein EI90DRAFT_3076910 [Cantharellus anzutake]KAF8323521.1 hypothetical protein EI90DRAFT_3076910 [Cantharellus anzutake]